VRGYVKRAYSIGNDSAQKKAGTRSLKNLEFVYGQEGKIIPAKIFEEWGLSRREAPGDNLTRANERTE